MCIWCEKQGNGHSYPHYGDKDKLCYWQWCKCEKAGKNGKACLKVSDNQESYPQVINILWISGKVLFKWYWREGWVSI